MGRPNCRVTALAEQFPDYLSCRLDSVCGDLERGLCRRGGHGNATTPPNWNVSLITDGTANWEPIGSTTSTGAFPGGPNGNTSSHMRSGGNNVGGIQNFAFCDGHVKAMNPQMTNPGKWDDYGQNKWDARRSCNEFTSQSVNYGCYQ